MERGAWWLVGEIWFGNVRGQLTMSSLCLTTQVSIIEWLTREIGSQASTSLEFISNSKPTSNASDASGGQVRAPLRVWKHM